MTEKVHEHGALPGVELWAGSEQVKQQINNAIHAVREVYP